jgi:CRP/FNR family transcriptional regulator
MATDSSKGSYVATDVFCESFFAKVDFGDYGWSPLREYPAFTEIIQQDTPARAVYFIEYGLVKLSRMDTLGHEVIAGLRRRNWIIGAPAVFLGKKYSFTATSLIDCKFRDISSERFLSLIETNPEFSRHMLRMFSHEIFNYGKAFFNLACLPAIDRLKRLLYEIMVEIKQPLGVKDKVNLIFPLKHKELAQMVAVTPEHLSRLLKQLERDGIIKREKGLLVMNNSQSLIQECGIQ